MLFSALAPTEGKTPATTGIPSEPNTSTTPSLASEIIGYDWEAGDGSLLELHSDGSFVWYQDPKVTDDYYYSGTYEVYMGQEAYDHVTKNLSSYGVTGPELDDVFDRNSDYSLENFCCLVLTNEELIIDKENTLDSPGDTPCYGFYFEDKQYLDIANMNTGTYWALTRL